MKFQNKKFAFSISRKVWLSLSIMIFCYLASLVFEFILGIESEYRLQRVSELVFPAAIQSKVALTEFNEQVRKYKEAVVLGESGYLEEAKTRAAGCHEALKILFTFLGEADTKNLRALLRELTDFTSAAGSLYSRMIANMETETFSGEASLLIHRSQELREKLQNLNNAFSQNLKSELVNVGNANRIQRYWNIAVFFIAVIFSLILVKLIISKSVTQPLQKVAALATAMAQGDLSKKLDIRQQDEIGDLAEAMNIMAQKIESSHSQLEQKVADRTASLERINQKLRAEISERERTENELKKTQEKLVEAAYLAEEANRSKSEFLANMSHEIRTPLSGVLGMIEMLANTPLTSEQRDYLNTINVSGEALLAIINDILDISKIEAGEFTLASGSFDLKKSIENILSIFAPKADKKGIDFHVQFSPTDSYFVRGDEVRVQQIIYNLVGNALKFTHEGKIEIRVNPGEILDNIMKFHIDVEDTGIGIKQEFIEHIFHKFTQADGSDTRKFGGTGLGLYITRQLVEMMGGAINVTSILGKGSTFHVLLPFFLEDHPEIKALKEKSEIGQEQEKIAANRSKKNLHILLAEDNPINQKLITAIIKTTGHKMDIVNNGKDAVEKVISDSYDLILMDLQMPEMNGVDATIAIRKAGFRELPIIAMTASAFKKDRTMCLEAGMNDYIAKPLKKDELLQMISKWE